MLAFYIINYTFIWYCAYYCRVFIICLGLIAVPVTVVLHCHHHNVFAQSSHHCLACWNRAPLGHLLTLTDSVIHKIILEFVSKFATEAISPWRVWLMIEEVDRSNESRRRRSILLYLNRRMSGTREFSGEVYAATNVVAIYLVTVNVVKSLVRLL